MKEGSQSKYARRQRPLSISQSAIVAEQRKRKAKENSMVWHGNQSRAVVAIRRGTEFYSKE